MASEAGQPNRTSAARLNAHDRRRGRLHERGQPRLGRAQPALAVAPRIAGGGHCAGEVVQLADGESPEDGRVAVGDGAGGAGDGGRDVGDAAGDGDGEAERNEEQGRAGDQPARLPSISVEHEARGECAERQRGGDEEEQVGTQGNGSAGAPEPHGGARSNIYTNCFWGRSHVATRDHVKACVIAGRLRDSA
jgi:hypothetical protein